MKINKAHTLFDERLNTINEVITKYIEKAVKKLNEMEELNDITILRYTKNVIDKQTGEQTVCVGLIASENEDHVLSYSTKLPQTFEKSVPEEVIETTDISGYNSLEYPEDTTEQPLDASIFDVRDYRENLK